MVPVSPWLRALWSPDKAQALGRAHLLPFRPLLARSFSLPTGGNLMTGLERAAPWRFYLFPPTLFGSHKHEWGTSASLWWGQMSNTNESLVGSPTWKCTFAPPLILACSEWHESNCSGRNETELQYLYRSSYNRMKSRTDNFALTCNVKYLINNLNILQIPSLIDSTWIAFCKLSGLKFKHIRVLWLVSTVITRVSAMHIYVATQIGCSIYIWRIYEFLEFQKYM